MLFLFTIEHTDDDDSIANKTDISANPEDSEFIKYFHTRDKNIRSKLIDANINLVHFIAKKFANRGESVDDLVSVGTIGLLNAIDRFDPSRGIRFATFATPTIMGEIKRHFRDKGWAIKVPRKLQELNLVATRANEALTSELQRTPTVAEIAAKIGASVDDTIEALELGQLYELKSLDTNESSGDGDDSQTSLEDYIGNEDNAITEFTDNARIEDALSRLSPRERTIILLRFFKGMSQTDVANKLHISQMHVSRIQHRALNKLRSIILLEEV